MPELDTERTTNVGPAVAEQRISADSHMAEPQDLWEKRLPARFKGRGPRFRKATPGETPHYERTGGWDPHERLRDQAYDGISAEVLYPTFANAAYEARDPALEEACVRVYNDWLIEFCSVAPDRFWGLALISLWNIDHAVQELERCKVAGLRGAVIGLVPPAELPYSSSHYDRFWAACQDLEMSVNLHTFSGPGRWNSERHAQPGLVPDPVHKHKLEMMHTIGDLVASGVMERNPGLKVVAAEAGVGWIPFFAQEFDFHKPPYFGRPEALPHLPSEYIQRQVYGTFINDEVGGRLLNWYGQDRFMWSNDYPHPDSSWPHSASVIARELGHLPSEVRRQVIGLTAASVYNNGELPPPPPPPPEKVEDLSAWDAHHPERIVMPR